MTVSDSELKRLQAFNNAILGRDSDLAEESLDLTEGFRTEASALTEDPEILFEQESIILRRTRPVLDIHKNATVLEFENEADSVIWKGRLQSASGFLDQAIRAVGRINLRNAPIEWVGTGWLVDEDILVTNRHVAQEFAARKGDGFDFIQRDEGLSAELDFLKEFGNATERVFRLTEVLDIVDAPGPDIAFFRIERVSGDLSLSRPIDLAQSPRETESVAVIGYPAFDSRIPDFTLMQEIYGSRYNHKRLAPGAVTYLEADRLYHNCTTLGGNSGSVVLDLESGQAMGLHYSGAFMRTNYAVRCDVVRQALDRVKNATPRPQAVPKPEVAPVSPVQQSTAAGGSITTTIPLTITVALGDPRAGVSPQVTAGTPTPVAPAMLSDDLTLDMTEAPAESYLDREGFDPDFLGSDKPTPLPRLSNPGQALVFEFGGETTSELKYQHFSVVMNEQRRMCAFSAVNIDGSKAKKAARVRWKWDGRIDRKHQIMKECYGNPPKFSRGHMTRRNDPGWGTETLAKRGNQDSMHVTNATPQMQAFNSPIWLELEDYALGNAIDDDMKICVFTGPFFKPDDPFYYGVQVPVSFWKVIAFVHDHSHQLSATGYRMDQTKTLPTQQEFVFGDFTSSHTSEAAQVSIRSIEAEAGLSFGGLAEIDPLGQRESLSGATARTPLLSSLQIQYF